MTIPTNRALGDDVIALVHHVELNETGWIDAASTKAVRFLFWLINEPCDESTLVSRQSEVGLSHLTLARVQTAISDLHDAQKIIPTSDGKFKLSEAEFASIDASVVQAEETENEVRKKVLAAAHRAVPALDAANDTELWKRFHREFIVPFIKEFGARSYELITGKATNTKQTAFINEFLDKFNEDEKDALEALILSLLDSSNKHCRKYVLRLLNSYFFQTAIRLPADVINSVFPLKAKTVR